MNNNIVVDITKHLLEDDKPSLYLNSIKNELKNSPLQILVQLEETEQEKEYHPEGNVWNHVMLVVDIAAKVKELANDKESFMFAALFHDIGKKSTTKKNKKGRWISYEHDKVGAELIDEILVNYIDDIKNIEKVKNLVNYHMHHLYIIKNLPFGNTEEMIKNVDVNDMILLFVCDKLGRGSLDIVIKEKVLNDISKIIEILKVKYNVELKEFNEKIREIVINIK